MFAGSALGWFAGGVFSLLLVIACVSDLRTRRIPNALVAVLGAGGVLYALASSPGILHGLGHAFGGAAVGLAFWLPFWFLRWLGAGDVKLFAAAGAWLGVWHTVEAAALAAMAGGVLTVGWMVWRRGWRASLETFALATVTPRVLDRPPASPGDRERRLPYALALAVGLGFAAWFPTLLI